MRHIINIENVADIHEFVDVFASSSGKGSGKRLFAIMQLNVKTDKTSHLYRVSSQGKVILETDSFSQAVSIYNEIN